MTKRQPQREQMLAFCDQVHEYDGVDPREAPRKTHCRRKPDRKAQQLCRQVGETIDMVLSGEFDDERLHNLRVVHVVPAPDCSRLLVTLYPDLAPGTATAQDILRLLDRASGRLRSEVAMAITRRRAPQLAFRIIEGAPESDVTDRSVATPISNGRE